MPIKVGDRVRLSSSDDIGTVIGIPREPQLADCVLVQWRTGEPLLAKRASLEILGSANAHT